MTCYAGSPGSHQDTYLLNWLYDSFKLYKCLKYGEQEFNSPKIIFQPTQPNHRNPLSPLFPLSTPAPVRASSSLPACALILRSQFASRTVAQSFPFRLLHLPAKSLVSSVPSAANYPHWSLGDGGRSSLGLWASAGHGSIELNGRFERL